MISQDFLELAKGLVQGTSEASRRRVISTAYYAVFHEFAEVLTTGLLGFGKPQNDDPRLGDWLRIYRALGHNELDKATKKLADDSIRNHLDYSEKLTFLSVSLTRLKTGRHSADYDPSFNVAALNITESVINDAENVFRLLDSYFRYDILDDGLARKLALDVLGIKERK